MGFLPGITISGTINPTEEGDSIGNYQLIDSDSGRQDQNSPKILRTVTIPGSADSNLIYTDNTNFFKNFNYEDFFKMKNKPDPALLGTSYLSK
jgi:hypothetical protein